MAIKIPFSCAMFLVSLCTTSTQSAVISTGLNASLDSGSLAGTTFPVSFSYDDSAIAPSGDSFITLNSFDFILLGTAFHKSDIFQGGQVIFHDAFIQNVTASFQVVLPSNPPVENITFGFGGDGVIGYIDNRGQFGGGSFSFTSTPEPASLMAAIIAVPSIFLRQKRTCRH